MDDQELRTDAVAAPLSELELACGLVFGSEPSATPLPAAGELGSPLVELARPLRRALERPPCLVAFSGGFDSSLVLSVARNVAVRQKLELPIPVTVRFARHLETQESIWQESVVFELGLSDWERLEVGEELELLGPWARRALHGAGPLWPPNAFMLLPLLDRASGGTLVTGIDGDAALGGSPWRRSAVLLPRAARRAVARRGVPHLGWLTADGRSEMVKAWVRDEGQQPVARDPWLRWYARSRHLAVMRDSFERVASLANARISHPLVDQRVLGAIAKRAGRRGFVTRQGAIDALFEGALPRALAARRGKATFSAPLWGHATRDVAAAMDLSGVPDGFVDRAALRAEWAKLRPDLRSAVLMQHVWLETQTPSGAAEPVIGSVRG
ncbi:MAG TPA: asparagine synthase-related protein [Thermoleophilaceae bacterium]